MRNITIIGTLTILLFAFTGNLDAYEIKTVIRKEMKWQDSNTLTFRVDQDTIPEADNTSMWNALETARWLFNHNPSNFRVRLTPDTGSVRKYNNESEIWGSDDLEAPAATYYGWDMMPIPFTPIAIPIGIKETDIIINTSDPDHWTSSAAVWDKLFYGGDQRSLPAVVLHEMGHAAGLAHVNYEYNIMGFDFQHLHVNGGFAFPYVGEDAADGLVHLYDLDSPHKEDVAVVHWKYRRPGGTDNAYSEHIKTGLYDTSDNLLIPVPVDYNGDGTDDARHYRVSPDQEVKVEFTYENNGANTQRDVRVGFYLSTDSIITTRDTLLRTCPCQTL